MLHFFGKRLRELHEVERSERGFTLIELLVVIIIIGILAAIAVPIFLNQRQKANEAACRSDVRNGVAAANSYAADTVGGSYAGMNTAGLIANYGWRLSPQSSGEAVGAAGGIPLAGVPGAGFTLAVTCANAPNTTYYFDSAVGRVQP